MSDSALALEALAACADAVRAMRPPPPSPAAVEQAAHFVGRALNVKVGAWLTPDDRIAIIPLATVAIGDILRAEADIQRVLGDEALDWIRIVRIGATDEGRASP